MKNNRFIICTLYLLFAITGWQCKKQDLHPGRSFYMGVTPWPSDFTTPAVDEAYNFINSNCDIVSHHFDEGIPYEESYSNLSWPQQLVSDVNFRKQKTASGKKVFLSVAALNLTRHEKADYYRAPDGITDSIKNYWKQLPYNDPKVITAYTRYIIFLVEQFHPSFVNFGVESNDIHWDPVQFTQYKIFISQVYANLKTQYPHIPFFVSLMVNEDPLALSLGAQLMPYSDYLTLSAYPYTSVSSSANGNTDPRNFPADYFTRFINLAPTKFAGFAETGYIAEDLTIPAYSLNKTGTSEWQRAYLEKVTALCQEHKAAFLIWFCSSDYDAGNERLKQLGLYQDLFGLWEDIGLKNENGQERPAYQVWLQWQQRPLQ